MCFVVVRCDGRERRINYRVCACAGEEERKIIVCVALVRARFDAKKMQDGSFYCLVQKNERLFLRPKNQKTASVHENDKKSLALQTEATIHER